MYIALVVLFERTPLGVCSSGVLYPEIIIVLLHILDEKGLMKIYHVAFLIFIDLGVA